MRGEFIDIDGSRIYCFAAGTRSAANPVVLVHGCFTSSYLWRDLTNRVPAGRRILVIDLLGHGRSDPPRGRAMTLAAHAARLEAILDIFGVKNAVLVGHGAGGAISARVAVSNPALISGLALIAPTFIGDAPTGKLHRRFRRIAYAVPLWKRLSGEWLASFLHAALLSGYSNRRSGARTLDVHLRGFRYAAGRDAACAQLSALGRAAEDNGTLIKAGALRCPVLLVTGGNDPFLRGTAANRLIAHLQSASGGNLFVHRIPEASHMVPEDAPELLGAALADFLKGKEQPVNPAF